MEGQEGRFLLANEKDAFREKAGNLFTALNGVQYSPTQDEDGFLKSDPLKDGRQARDCRSSGRSMRQGRINYALGSTRVHDRTSGSNLMPPPRVPAMKRRCRQSIPEYVKNPSKFTKYTLDDVPEQHMTQKSNTAAAFAFLREMDEKRKDQIEAEDHGCKEGRPMFKKPCSNLKARPKPVMGLMCSSSKSKPCQSESATDSQSRSIPNPKSKKREVKLSHLDYEEEEE